MDNSTADPTFRVASFQGRVTEKNPEASLDRTCEALEWADARDAHVLCMPETYLQGYFENEDEARANSIDLDSAEFADVCDRVAAFNATLLLGLNERRGDDIYNTVVVIEKGRLVGRYSKCHTCYPYFARGTDFPVFERDGVKFGVIICADTSFVEPARIEAMRGAQVFFAPHFNRIMPENVDHHTRRVRRHNAARAAENGCWLVRSNVIWPGDTGKVGVGDSFILNEIGEPVCEAGILRETMLFHAIPRERLGPSPHFWNRTLPAVADQLRAEYNRFTSKQAASRRKSKPVAGSD